MRPAQLPDIGIGWWWTSYPPGIPRGGKRAGCRVSLEPARPRGNKGRVNKGRVDEGFYKEEFLVIRGLDSAACQDPRTLRSGDFFDFGF